MTPSIRKQLDNQMKLLKVCSDTCSDTALEMLKVFGHWQTYTGSLALAVRDKDSESLLCPGSTS